MADATEIFVIPRALLEMPGLPGPMARMTKMVEEGGYLTIATFLQALSAQELMDVLHAGRDSERGTPGHTAMLLFSALMACHEGLVVLDDGSARKLLSRVLVFTQAELLARKGLLELPYTALSLEAVRPADMQITLKGRQTCQSQALARPRPPFAAPGLGA